MAKKKRRHPERPLPLKWEFEADIPTHDFLAGRDLTNPGTRSLAVHEVVRFMGRGGFLAWEAVMANEQGLRLTHLQESAFSTLNNAETNDDGRIVCISGSIRPKEPWYDTINKIVPQMITEPFRTTEPHLEIWSYLVDDLHEEAGGLSLPPGVASPVEVVLEELRHKLWLQDCYDALCELDGTEEVTLENDEQCELRMEDFVSSLREQKESVQYFDLTIDSLLTKVIVPEKEGPILIREMLERLGMKSTAEPLANYL